jgi:thiamine pyridinylase
MKHKLLEFNKTKAIVVSVMLVAQMGYAQQTELAPIEAHPNPQVLTVGLYQWVPRIHQVERIVRRAWAKVHPEVAIKFDRDWGGGYYAEPGKALDVFIFDAMFLKSFMAKNLLLPMAIDQVQDIDDFYAYARVETPDHKSLYALPYLGCTNFIFYRQGDDAVANAEDIKVLSSVMTHHSYEGVRPHKNQGLMFNLSDPLTVSSFYLKLVYDINHRSDFDLPDFIEALNPQAVEDLHQLISLSSQAHVTHYSEPFKRAKMFDRGFGRALIAYTESMSQMSEATLKQIDFNLFPLGSGKEKSVFYADMIGVSSRIEDAQKRALSVELAHLIASTEVLVKSYGPTARHANPQYVIPLRQSAFAQLAEHDEIYTRLKNRVDYADKTLYALPWSSQDWFADMQQNISDYVFESL